MWVKSLRRSVRRVLDRPGTRWLGAAMVSIYRSVKSLRPCTVRHASGVWYHRYGDCVLVSPTLGMRDPDTLMADTTDLYCHVYECSPGDTVLDIGAGDGAETMVFSRMVGTEGFVLSIEAHPRTFHCLDQMVKINRMDNVIALHAAVNRHAGVVHISDNAMHTRNTIMGRGELTIDSVTGDYLMSKYGLQRVDLLKINIEGAEVEALEGMEDLLRITRHICVCCHDFLAEQGQGEEFRTKKRVVDLLSHAGFEVTHRDDARPYVRDQALGVRPRSGTHWRGKVVHNPGR